MPELGTYNHDNSVGLSLHHFPNGRKPAERLLSYFALHATIGDLERKKYSEVYKEHVENSGRMILDAANAVPQGGNALILGIGNAMEIPLLSLLNTFDSVTAVEIDEHALTRTVAAVPTELQHKIVPVVDDISGISASLSDLGMSVLDSATDVDDFGAKIADKLRTISPAKVDFGTDYQFIVSSLVMSQLALSPLNYVFDCLRKRYGQASLASDAIKAKFESGFSDLIRRLDRQHISLLAESAATKGQVYLSDHMAEYTVHADGNDQITWGQEISRPRNIQILERDITEHFVIEKSRDWTWTRIPPTAETNNEGELFKIRGYSLAPMKER